MKPLFFLCLLLLNPLSTQAAGPAMLLLAREWNPNCIGMTQYVDAADGVTMLTGSSISNIADLSGHNYKLVGTNGNSNTSNPLYIASDTAANNQPAWHFQSANKSFFMMPATGGWGKNWYCFSVMHYSNSTTQISESTSMSYSSANTEMGGSCRGDNGDLEVNDSVNECHTTVEPNLYSAYQFVENDVTNGVVTFNTTTVGPSGGAVTGYTTTGSAITNMVVNWWGRSGGVYSDHFQAAAGVSLVHPNAIQKARLREWARSRF